jgi:hypothetical protein
VSPLNRPKTRLSIFTGLWRILSAIILRFIHDYLEGVNDSLSISMQLHQLSISKASFIQYRVTSHIIALASI